MEIKAPTPQIPPPGWTEFKDLQEMEKYRQERPEGDKHSALFENVTEGILHFPGGYRTLEVTFGLRSTAADPFTRFTQIAAVDSNVQSLYLLVIGCAATCYDQNQHAIEEVLDSWTLKEK